MSLTANQLHKTMMSKKAHWQSAKFVPPYSAGVQTLDNDPNAQFVYEFEPQRIRQFEIDYNTNKVPEMKVKSVVVGSNLN